jgi:phospholipid-binding lipoprotein MlaA
VGRYPALATAVLLVAVVQNTVALAEPGGTGAEPSVVEVDDVAADDGQLFGDALEDDLFGEPLLEVADPFEGLNRAVFAFNDKLYFYALKPVARLYRHVPERVRVSVGNFFSNLTAPIRVVNNVLQGKIGSAGGELMRFIVNSTVGIGGLFDPATRYARIPRSDEDFGQTLGRYGIGSGPYLVLPMVGPCNVRDGVGLAVDLFLDPVPYVVGGAEYLAAKGTSTVNEVSLDDDTYEGIKRDALDPYLFVRDAYAQHRAGKIAQ